jgi:hypothetical protein
MSKVYQITFMDCEHIQVSFSKIYLGDRFYCEDCDKTRYIKGITEKNV